MDRLSHRPARGWVHAVAAWLAAALLVGCGTRVPAPQPTSPGTWQAAWGSAMLVAPPPPPGVAPVPPWQLPMRDVTLRQIVRVTVAGRALRVQVSNLFGEQPLVIDTARVARVQALAPAPQIDVGTLRALTFAGQHQLTLPPHAEVWSDPVELDLPAGADLAVQWHVASGPAQVSAHPGSRIRSWAWTGAGESAPEGAGAVPQEGWWHLAAIDVRAPAAVPVLVATGDSITDGYGVPSGSYQRWTDVLVQRLAAAGRTAAVVNTGIGGGRLLRDGLGPHLVSRFDRDVLARTGVTHAVVLIGVNDLGTSHRGRPTTPASRAALLDELKAGFSDLARRARERGVCLIGATVMPYGGSGYYAPQPENEADRQALNAWLREPGRLDALVDFDALMRDAAQPARLRPEVDNDGLHPSLAGYRAMAEAFPVALLERRCPVRVSGP